MPVSLLVGDAETLSASKRDDGFQNILFTKRVYLRNIRGDEILVSRIRARSFSRFLEQIDQRQPEA
jgi:hypothetical protein